MYQRASSIIYSTPLRIVVTFFTLPLITCAAYILPSVESSQPGTKSVLFRSNNHPTVFRINLLKLLELSFAQNLVEKLVRKELAGAVGGVPVFHDDEFDAPHGFFLGDARVGDAVQVAIVGSALVVIVRDKVRDWRRCSRYAHRFQ